MASITDADRTTAVGVADRLESRGTDFLAFATFHCERGIALTAAQLDRVRADATEDAVHDLRVSARQLLSTLDCFAAPLGPERIAALRKCLKSILSRGRRVRDVDIALRLARKAGLDPRCPLLSTLRERRGNFKSLLLEQVRRRRFREFRSRWISSLGGATTGMRGDRPVGRGHGSKSGRQLAWRVEESTTSNARRVLPLLAAEYFAKGRATCTVDPMPAQLHEFRLAGKRLRYCLELFAELYGAALDERILLLKDTQRHLGGLSDCDASEKLLQTAGLPPGPELEVLLRFLRERAISGTQLFLAFWHEHFGAEKAEEDWLRCLAGSCAEGPSRSGNAM